MLRLLPILIFFPLTFLSLPAFASITCPANASPDYLGQRCRCDVGYQVKNNQCLKIIIPENATLSLMGGWRCNTGYQKNGNKCDKVKLPKNARFIGGTSVWTCDKGYQKQSNSCIKVHLPENAHFAFGSSWQCDAGFKRAGGECLAMNQQELVNQVKSLNRMLMMQISESAGGNGNCSTGFTYCKRECDSQFSSYSNENKCIDACKKGQSACN